MHQQQGLRSWSKESQDRKVVQINSSGSGLQCQDRVKRMQQEEAITLGSRALLRNPFLKEGTL